MVKGMNDIIEAWERIGLSDPKIKSLKRRLFESALFFACIGGFIGFLLFELSRKSFCHCADQHGRGNGILKNDRIKLLLPILDEG